jgi:hypothetical protein
LGILFLPYFYRVLLLPFTLRSYFRGNIEGDSLVGTSSVVVAKPTTARFDLWRGVRAVVGPMWESPPDTTKISSKRVTATTKAKAPVKPEKVTAVKTVTKSVTQTVQQTVQIPVQVYETPSIEDPYEKDSVISELHTMGWHQVSLCELLTRRRSHFHRKVEGVILSL